MKNVKAIAVYCGSKVGNSPAFANAARELGEQLVARDIELVFGGGRIGIMGVVADQVLAGGGKVTGVIPHFLDSLELGHEGATDLVKVETMHERKNIMFRKSDAFVILPGGLGTLDECFEVITWKQLQLHSKPVVMVNIEGCWDNFRKLVDDIVQAGFAHPKVADLYTIVDSVDQVFEAIAAAPEPGRIVLEDHL